MNFKTVIIFFADYVVFISYKKDKKEDHFLRYYTKEDMVVNLSLITLIFKKYFFPLIYNNNGFLLCS